MRCSEFKLANGVVQTVARESEIGKAISSFSKEYKVPLKDSVVMFYQQVVLGNIDRDPEKFWLTDKGRSVAELLNAHKSCLPFVCFIAEGAN